MGITQITTVPNEENFNVNNDNHLINNIKNLDFFHQIKDLVVCLICKGLLINPTQCSQCENSFCFECIKSWSTKYKKCPYDCYNSTFSPAVNEVNTLLHQIQFFENESYNNLFFQKETKANNSIKSKMPNKGYGIYIFDNGLYYEGYWLEEKMHGVGKMIYSNGFVYEGELAMGLREGYGCYKTKKGEKGSGYWVNNKKNGKTMIKYSNGDLFIGEYVNDVKEGYGKYIFKNGEYYEGYWSNNAFNGIGKMHYFNGATYYGQWVNNQKEGNGVFISPNGFKYDGVWEKNKRGTKGYIIFTTGEKTALSKKIDKSLKVNKVNPKEINIEDKQNNIQTVNNTWNLLLNAIDNENLKELNDDKKDNEILEGTPSENNINKGNSKTIKKKKKTIK